MLHHYSGGGHGEDVTAGPAMASTFSVFFPLPDGHQWPPAEEAAYDDHSTITTSPSSPSSSSTGSVDCTLSLGTPSSRRAEPAAAPANHGAPAHYPSKPATVSWDAAGESYYCQHGRPAARHAVANGVQDPLLDRRCANCGTTSTPLWRNGPRGPKSLCNACGIRFKKEERRAAATATADGGSGAGCGFSAQRTRGPAARAPPAATCCGGGGDVADAPFLAWQLNVVQPAATAFSVWPERAMFQYN